jgi:hypothetical protein
MRLFEHPDFTQAIIRTRDHFTDQGINLSEQFIEKDYYVTEALRIIAEQFAGKIIFKGGTSLSKGWNLIQRFSEDIDIFLDPLSFDPPLSNPRQIDRALKSLRDAVNAHPGLTYIPPPPGVTRTIGGFKRDDYFAYQLVLQEPNTVAPVVRIEAGTASGTEPTVDVSLNSYIGLYLNAANISLEVEDEQPFAMRLLHFRRTFVEKMFAIHSKIELYKRDQAPLGSYARHYYDLTQLALRGEVRAMLADNEYGRIKADYQEIARRAFPNSYFAPNAMSFATSDALFPSDDLRVMIAAEYETQCKVLCFGPYPFVG